MRNIVKEKLERGEQVIGTLMMMGSIPAVKALGYSGLDYIMIDAEHGPYDTETILKMIVAAESVNLTPFVRVADVTHGAIQRMVDIGAKGLIIPCLRELEEFRKTVYYAKFAPVGNRGFTQGIGCGYGYEDWVGDMDTYMRVSNEQLLLLPQCETKEALEQIEEIAAIDGIDGIFLGPNDLSIALGIPGRFGDERFTAALERIRKACDAYGKPIFMYAGDIGTARQYIKEGYAGILQSVDANVFVEAYRDIVGKIRA